MTDYERVLSYHLQTDNYLDALKVLQRQVSTKIYVRTKKYYKKYQKILKSRSVVCTKKKRITPTLQISAKAPWPLRSRNRKEDLQLLLATEEISDELLILLYYFDQPR